MIWNKVDEPTTVEPNDFLIFYVPEGNYILGRGADLCEVKEKHPTVSHYCLLASAPK